MANPADVTASILFHFGEKEQIQSHHLRLRMCENCAADSIGGMTAY